MISTTSAKLVTMVTILYAVVSIFSTLRLLPLLSLSSTETATNRSESTSSDMQQGTSFEHILNQSSSSSSILPAATSLSSSMMPDHSTWLVQPLEELNKGGKNDGGRQIEIPKVIYKVFIQKKGGFQNMTEENQNLTQAHLSWEKYNTDYQVRYFDLMLCRKYLKMYFHPIFLRSFDCIQNFAGKADFFRIAVLYREGGWYSDWKQVCLQNNLLNRLGNGTELVLFRDEAVINGAKMFPNAFLGATPQHPYLIEILKLLFHHVHISQYAGSALNTTGPMLLDTGWRIAEQKNMVNQTENILGKYNVTGYFFDLENNPVILHKCTGCGAHQSWENGNIYWAMHRKKTFYCEDAATIFEKV